MEYPNLIDLARQAAYELGEQGDHKVQRCLYHAMQIFKRLNYDTLRNIKTAELVVRPNKSVAFPEDMIAWTKIGVLHGQQFITLTENQQLVLSPGRDTTASKGYWFANCVLNGQSVGRVFGGLNLSNPWGTFRVDQKNKQILFGSDMEESKIYLEYIGTGIETTANTLVHPFAEETILAYIAWKMLVPKRNVGLGEKQMAEEEFKRQHRLLALRMQKFSVKDFLQALRSGYTLTVKN